MGKRTTQLNEITTVDNNDILYGVDVDDLTHSPDGTSVKFKKSNLLKEVNSDVSELQGIISGLLDWFYPIGTIYETTSSDLDTTTKMGNHFGGTWEVYGAGRVLVGKAGSGTFATAGATMGKETHTLTVAEMPSHTHGSKSLVGKMQFRALTSGANIADIYSSGNSICSYTGDGGATWGNGINYTSGSNKPTDVITVNATHEHSSVGGNGAHNNIQPSIVVFRYRRIA